MTTEKPGEDASAEPAEHAQQAIDEAKAAAERARDLIEDPDYEEQAETGEDLQEGDEEHEEQGDENDDEQDEHAEDDEQ